MFEWATHSSTRVKMLKMFFKDPHAPLYGLEVSQHLGASPGTTHRELNTLLSQGIISKKREGALVMYRLNTHHPYFRELKKALFPKKKTERVILLGGIFLNPREEKKKSEDLRLVLDYAEDNASELIFLGNTLRLESLFETYIAHRKLFRHLVELAHELTVTFLSGESDLKLDLLSQEKILNLPFHVKSELVEEKYGIYASGRPVKRPEEEARKLMGKGFSYVVLGAPKGASFKEFDQGIYFSPGHFEQGDPHFVEIDQEGGALIAVKDLRV